MNNGTKTQRNLTSTLVSQQVLELIAGDYVSAANDPSNSAWKAFINETLNQFQKLVANGWHFIIVDENPYESLDALVNDARLKILKVFSGGRLTWDNPLNAFTSAEAYYLGHIVPLSVNEVFRIVHDVYGHYGWDSPGVSPIVNYPFETIDGEVSAYLRHKLQYSPESHGVLFTETIGQLAYHEVVGKFVDVQEAKIIPVRF